MKPSNELLEEIENLKKENDKLKKSINYTKFGIVWMDIPEAFEKESENKLPLLEEIKEKELNTEENTHVNLLIEGDNFHSLTCLNYSHKDAIDVIYIDPPYNTEKGDFKYKDKRVIDKYPNGQPVKKDDPIRHSKWLSFIYKRLLLARELLKSTGVIMISIDDNEVAQLKMLCDQVFKGNFIACLPTIMNLKGNNDQFGFAGTHEYTLVYAKDISKVKLNEFEVDEDEIEKKWEVDDIGYYKEGANLKSTGVNAPRAKRANLFFPILVDPKSQEISFITDDEYEKIYNKIDKTFNDDYINELKQNYEKKGLAFILPKTKGELMTWRWSLKKMRSQKYDIIVKPGKNKSISIVKKQRPQIGDIPSKKPKSLFYKPEYSSGNGTSQQKRIFGKKVFDNPKPLELVKDLIHIGGDKDALVLDFFAGSGTTGHAVLELNKLDSGNRRFILCTNNEDNICEEVTYKRLKRLHAPQINKLDINPLPSNLKYYKTKFAGHKIDHISDDDKIEVAHNAGELVAIAEDIHYETKKNQYSQFFTDKQQTKLLAIYFSEDFSFIENFKKDLLGFVGNGSQAIVYVFSWGNEDHSYIFDDLNIEFELKPIPQPILEIYKKIYRG